MYKKIFSAHSSSYFLLKIRMVREIKRTMVSYFNIINEKYNEIEI